MSFDTAPEIGTSTSAERNELKGATVSFIHPETYQNVSGVVDREKSGGNLVVIFDGEEFTVPRKKVKVKFRPPVAPESETLVSSAAGAAEIEPQPVAAVDSAFVPEPAPVVPDEDPATRMFNAPSSGDKVTEAKEKISASVARIAELSRSVNEQLAKFGPSHIPAEKRQELEKTLGHLRNLSEVMKSREHEADSTQLLFQVNRTAGLIAVDIEKVQQLIRDVETLAETPTLAVAAEVPTDPTPVLDELPVPEDVPAATTPAVGEISPTVLPEEPTVVPEQEVAQNNSAPETVTKAVEGTPAPTAPEIMAKIDAAITRLKENLALATPDQQFALGKIEGIRARLVDREALRAKHAVTPEVRASDVVLRTINERNAWDSAIVEGLVQKLMVPVVEAPAPAAAAEEVSSEYRPESSPFTRASEEFAAIKTIPYLTAEERTTAGKVYEGVVNLAKAGKSSEEIEQALLGLHNYMEDLAHPGGEQILERVKQIQAEVAKVGSDGRNTLTIQSLAENVIRIAQAEAAVQSDGARTDRAYTNLVNFIDDDAVRVRAEVLESQSVHEVPPPAPVPSAPAAVESVPTPVPPTMAQEIVTPERGLEALVQARAAYRDALIRAIKVRTYAKRNSAFANAGERSEFEEAEMPKVIQAGDEYRKQLAATARPLAERFAAVANSELTSLEATLDAGEGYKTNEWPGRVARVGKLLARPFTLVTRSEKWSPKKLVSQLFGRTRTTTAEASTPAEVIPGVSFNNDPLLSNPTLLRDTLGRVASDEVIPSRTAEESEALARGVVAEVEATYAAPRAPSAEVQAAFAKANQFLDTFPGGPAALTDFVAKFVQLAEGGQQYIAPGSRVLGRYTGFEQVDPYKALASKSVAEVLSLKANKSPLAVSQKLVELGITGEGFNQWADRLEKFVKLYPQLNSEKVPFERAVALMFADAELLKQTT